MGQKRKPAEEKEQCKYCTNWAEGLSKVCGKHRHQLDPQGISMCNRFERVQGLTRKKPLRRTTRKTTLPLNDYTS